MLHVIAVLLAFVALPLVEAQLRDVNTCNVLLQWGPAALLGVGPHATGDLAIPPTPTGVFDDGIRIPIDATEYFHSSNGQMALVVTRAEGRNAWFVMGQTPNNNRNRYSSPINITHLLDNPTPAESSVITNPLLAVEMLENMMAAVVVVSSNRASVMTWAFMEYGPMPLGRALGSSNGNPGKVIDIYFSSPESVNLVCGQCYCAVSNSTWIYTWSVNANGCEFFPMNPDEYDFYGLGRTIEAVAGMRDAFVIATSTSLYFYGRNTYSRFGVPQAEWSSFQRWTTRGSNTYTALACGSFHCLGILSNGSLTAWGDNTQGQCGVDPQIDIEIVDTLYPSGAIFYDLANLPVGFDSILSVGAIGETSYALLSNGELYAWGRNSNPSSPYGDSYLMFGVPTVRISTHLPTHNYMMPANYQIFKAPTITSASNPSDSIHVIVPANVTSNIFAADRTYRRGLSALTKPFDEGGAPRPITWGAARGASEYGVYGLIHGNRSVSGSAIFTSAAMAVEMPPLPNGQQPASFAIGGSTTYFLTTVKRLYAWGTLSTGTDPLVPEQGIDASQMAFTSAFPIFVSGARNYDQIAAAYSFTCGSYQDLGTTHIECWGVSYASNHLLVSDDLGANYGSTGLLRCGTHSCAYIAKVGDTDTTYFTWGHPDSPHSNALCRDVNADITTPTSARQGDIVNGETIVHVTIGESFMIIGTNQALYGCGQNLYKQLGTSNTQGVDTPTLIPGGEMVYRMASGKSHTLGLLPNTSILCWGSNEFGQLGRPGIGDSMYVGLVDGLTGISEIATVKDTSFAMQTSGALYAWGFNGFQSMFGTIQPGVPFSAGYSAVPINVNPRTGVGRDLGLPLPIVSSPFSETVMMPVHFRPDHEDHPDRQSKLISFGADQKGVLMSSPVEPVAMFQYSEEPVVGLTTFIKDARRDDYQGAFVTTDGQLFTRGYSLPSLTDPASELFRAPFRKSFYLAHTDPLIEDIELLTDGVLMRLSTGEVKALTESLTLAQGAITFLPGQIVDMECSRQYCGFLDSNSQLRFQNLANSREVNTSNVDKFGIFGGYFYNSNDQQLKYLTFSGGVLRAHPDDPESSAPVTVVTGALSQTSGIYQIAAGYDHALIVGNDGRLYGLGSNEDGKLGSDHPLRIVEEIFPDFFSINSRSIISVFAGYRTSFVLTPDGVYGWGFLPSAGFSIATSSDLDTYFGSISIHYQPILLDFTSAVGSPYYPSGVATSRFSTANTESPDGPVSEVHWVWSSEFAPSAPPWESSPPPSNPPSSPPPQPVPVSTPPTARQCPPPPTSDNWVCDVSTGTLTLVGNLQVAAGATLDVKGHIKVEGDLSIPAGASIKISVSATLIADSGPIMNITGCADVGEPIVMDLDKEALKSLKKSDVEGTTVQVVESSCRQAAGKLLVSTPEKAQQGCRRYTAKQDETVNGARANLNAIMVVTRDSCNHWWIILVSVLGTVIIIVGIVVLLVIFTPLKQKVLPYFGAN